MSRARDLSRSYNEIKSRLAASFRVQNPDIVALSNIAQTKGFIAHQYIGTGASNPINLGIPLVDTVAGFTDVNGDTITHDRTTGDCIVKVNGVAVESGSGVFNSTTGFGASFHIKNLSDTLAGNYYNNRYDSLRGAGQVIFTNATAQESLNTNRLSAINNAGFVLGTDIEVNKSGSQYIAYITIYTHYEWGLTNQGKRYFKLFNPKTGEELIMYQGSGIAGHQIPTDGKYNLVHLKNLGLAVDWDTDYNSSQRLNLNLSNAGSTVTILEGYKDNFTINANGTANNTPGYTYIAYVSKNTQHVKIGEYVGNGGTKEVYDNEGNLLFTLNTTDGNTNASSYRYTYNAIIENGKIVMIIVKSLTLGTTQWVTYDFKRGKSKEIYLNLTSLEATVDKFNFFNPSTTDMTFNRTTDNNEAGSQSQVSLTNAYLHYTKGKDLNGYIIGKTDLTVDVPLGVFSGLADGNYYVLHKDGTSGTNVSDYLVATGVEVDSYTKESANDNRLVFKREDGKLYDTTGGELVTNGTFDTDVSGWTAGSDVTISQENGMMKITTTSTSSTEGTYQSISTVIGETYRLEFTLGNLQDYINLSLDDLFIGSYSSSGNFVYEFVATSTSTKIEFYRQTSTAGWIYYVDNVSVYKKQATLNTIQPDSSVIGKFKVNSETPVEKLDLDIPMNVTDSLEVSKLTTSENRVVREIGTIYNNNRYVIPFENFFDDYSGNPLDYEADISLSVDGSDWFKVEVAWATSPGTVGVTAYPHNDGIRIQTGENTLANADSNAYGLNTRSDGGGDISSALARVIVTYLGKTKER